MDLILCRNVLMYFDAEIQQRSVSRLQHALSRGGWLVLSPVEASPELLCPLAPVVFPDAVFHRSQNAGEAPLPVLAGPVLPGAPVVLERGVGLETQQVMPEPAPLPLPTGAGAHGQLENARQLAEAAVAESRLDPERHLLLAAISQELGDTAAARDSLRRTIYLAPESAPAHFLLGTILLRDGERRRGRRCLENAIRLLDALPGEQAVDGAGGLTAGRLRETARSYLVEG
jgi:chemotaxis protein methyltransferase CheR